MSDSIFHDPDFRAWEQNVREGMIPKLQESGAVVSLVPNGDKVDPKFCVELGASIMLDKPILAVVEPGSDVPAKLRLVADEIVFADLHTDEGKRAVQAAITRFMDRDADGE